MKLIPLERLLSETDAPYLTPEPYRGKTNSPEYIPYVVDGMSKVLNMDKEKLAKKLYENACEFFNVVE
jgi:TatD DNase family protein